LTHLRQWSTIATRFFGNMLQLDPQASPRVSTIEQPPLRGCPACGRRTAHAHLYAIRNCTILRCAACGLGRTEAPSFDPERYYTDDYFTGQHADGYADYRGAEAVLRREFARTVEFIRARRAGGRLLEVGCAYGFFLQEAKPFFEVAGIELAADAAVHARGAGLHVLTGVADEATLAGLGSFDVIVMLDVIEHLPDPLDLLRLLGRHLAPGGIVVITTGDFASLVARLLGKHWRLMTPPQHLWFFTPESLSRMARAAGLDCEHVDHPSKIVPLSLVRFQLRRMLGLPQNASPRAGGVGLPLNLFDAMRVVLRRPA
jgi:2-polyprenyl-3-methyl-5-hydroxy-6-metoxy-1,4-benzoquinol methylase